MLTAKREGGRGGGRWGRGGLTRSLGGSSGIVSSFSARRGVRVSTKESKSFLDWR